VEQCFVEVG
jgi:hypothetical protein